MTRREHIIGGFLVLLVSILVGLASFVVTDRFSQIGENEKQIDNAAASLRVILAVTGCTVEDTSPECLGRIQAASTAEGDRRIAEVDCVTRRAVAGLPAPIPPGTCISQTPPEVYPGITRPPPSSS